MFVDNFLPHLTVFWDVRPLTTQLRPFYPVRYITYGNRGVCKEYLEKDYKIYSTMGSSLGVYEFMRRFIDAVEYVDGDGKRKEGEIWEDPRRNSICFGKKGEFERCFPYDERSIAIFRDHLQYKDVGLESGKPVSGYMEVRGSGALFLTQTVGDTAWEFVARGLWEDVLSKGVFETVDRMYFADEGKQFSQVIKFNDGTELILSRYDLHKYPD